MASRPDITAYGKQSGTERTCYFMWDWGKSHTDRYKVVWYYDTGGTVFVGSTEEIYASEPKQSFYDAPANARLVKFKVLPIAQKHTVKKKPVSYWTASYSTLTTINLTEQHIETPPAPTVSISGYKLTASYTNLPTTGGGTNIRFTIYDASKNKVYKVINTKIKNRAASCVCNVPAAGIYYVYAAAYKGKLYSHLSDNSGYVYTPPETPPGYESYKATSESSVYIDWKGARGQTSYTLQYTDNKDYFDSNPQGVQTVTITGAGHAEVTNLASGKRWYFRVRANNSAGSSGWAKIINLLLGSPPEAPTTWCFQSYVTPAEQTTIYWTHNTVDGSAQTKAQVRYKLTGGELQYVTINGTDSSYSLNNTTYTDGSVIRWQVRTAGIYAESGSAVYGGWAPTKTYTVIEPTTISIECDDELNTYPFNITVTGDPLSHVLGYNLSVVSLSDYDYTDDLGYVHHTSIGDEVFNRYFPSAESDLDFDLTFVDADLENNCDYKVVATVTSIYGEAVSAEAEFSVLLDDEEYDIDAEILVDEDALTASIHPYATDPETGDLVTGIKLTVYRREFNGRLVNIQAGEDTYIDNEAEQFVTDPHPSLDFARYRVVAVSESTGISTFADIPAYPIGEENIVIQWDEQWSGFDAGVEDETEEPSWSGSMIKIGYDINISEEYTKDSELIKYAGRTDPVSYYGTNMETKSTWSAAIITLDPDLLYQLRRLANYTGDVYVREPSGIGYWANVQVDIQKDQISPVARVSLDVQKVEGGA
jgi:hypothetical protein